MDSNLLKLETLSLLRCFPHRRRYLDVFAGVAEAGYLLSRVYCHMSDASLPPDYREDEAQQLDRTLEALIQYLETNKGTAVSAICYQTGFVYRFASSSTIPADGTDGLTGMF